MTTTTKKITTVVAPATATDLPTLDTTTPAVVVPDPIPVRASTKEKLEISVKNGTGARVVGTTGKPAQFKSDKIENTVKTAGGYDVKVSYFKAAK